MNELFSKTLQVVHGKDEGPFCEECADLEAQLDAEQYEREQNERRLYTKRQVGAMIIEALRVATGGQRPAPTAMNRLLLAYERELPDADTISC